MTEILLNLLDENPDSWELRQEALKTMELVLKEAGGFPNEIRAFMETISLPPEPPDPKVVAEMERKRAEEEARLAAEAAALEDQESEEEVIEDGKPVKKKKVKKAKVPKIGQIQSDSRRGSLVPDSRRGSAASITLGGVERRGSYYSEDVSKKATVAMVVDDKKEYDGKLDSLFSIVFFLLDSLT